MPGKFPKKNKGEMVAVTFVASVLDISAGTE